MAENQAAVAEQEQAPKSAPTPPNKGKGPATHEQKQKRRKMIRRGIALVRDGGYLATCSCSHFMTPELFAQTVGEAARDARRRLRQVEYRTQSPDHPVLWGADQSLYLKFYIFQVVDDA